jgi:rhamnogalacturonan endolyase
MRAAVFRIALFCLINITVRAGAQTAPAQVTETDAAIVMDNGIIRLNFDKKLGEVNSIQYRVDGKWIELSNQRDGMYADLVATASVKPEREASRPASNYFRPFRTAGTPEIVSKDPALAEVAWVSRPTEWCPFELEAHWLLPRGQSGFYAYQILHHGPGMNGSEMASARFAIKGVPGTKLFTHHIVDDRRDGPFPTGKVVETVQDATVRLEDGSVYTKYDNSAFNCDYLVHGMAGSGVGVWMCWPSVEFNNGGPLRQDLTVHEDNVLLAQFTSAHFGAAVPRVEQNEPWRQVYGPVFVYLNHGASVEAMHEDARTRALAERAKWPYRFIHDPDYPLERGQLRGRLQLSDGGNPEGALVVLDSEAGDEDFSLNARGYTFFTRADRNGAFTIDKVRPGVYTLWFSGADQFETLKRENVRIDASATNDLGTIEWRPPTHGRRLWQIGVADRASAEFRDGDDPRNYARFLNYFKAFPDDVTFTIGKSDPKRDWNYAQWEWYSRRPEWTIAFDLDRALQGKATLTLGFAAAHPAGSLQIRVNGQTVESPPLPRKTGTAPYRSGSQDSQYTLRYVTFDANLLKQGANQITLFMSRSIPMPQGEALLKLKRPNKALMYDAIRLEVEE